MEKNMKQFKKVASVLVAAMVVCLSCACKEEKPYENPFTPPVGTSSEEAPSEEATTEPSEESQADPDATVYPFEFTDAYGNKATIEKDPERIVSCSPAVTEIIFSLGQEESIVGLTMLDNYPAEASDYPVVIEELYNPNVEAIVAAEPDLVLADSIFPEEAYNQLTELGYTVVIVNEEKNVDGVYNKIESIGKILDANKEAAEVIADMKAKIEDVKEKIADYTDEKPTVYYCVSYGEYGDYTCGGDTFIHTIIEDAGGINIAADVKGWSYSQEDLIDADPDIIIVADWAYDDFIATAPYSELSAVKNGQVYGVNTDSLDRQCARNADAVAMLAEIFYPEAFAAKAA